MDNSSPHETRRTSVQGRQWKLAKRSKNGLNRAHNQTMPGRHTGTRRWGMWLSRVKQKAPRIRKAKPLLVRKIALGEASTGMHRREAFGKTKMLIGSQWDAGKHIDNNQIESALGETLKTREKKLKWYKASTLNWLKPGETVRGSHQKALQVKKKAHNLLRKPVENWAVVVYCRLRHGGTEPRTECLTILLKL